ncbi:hypothetical protein COV18_04225 [Candidatus Woesearchaeota archaeon CG10_big_fil_rev_8_21_14_0_10_37_12]|nr:MAG: hypothetical protein COV18_04225 [Candidatus Woesearchaeota archaeon CG10_big_fil_rev_8_21_14_0_10_37_12]
MKKQFLIFFLITIITIIFATIVTAQIVPPKLTKKDTCYHQHWCHKGVEPNGIDSATCSQELINQAYDQIGDTIPSGANPSRFQNGKTISEIDVKHTQYGGGNRYWLHHNTCENAETTTTTDSGTISQPTTPEVTTTPPGNSGTTSTGSTCTECAIIHRYALPCTEAERYEHVTCTGFTPTFKISGASGNARCERYQIHKCPTPTQTSPGTTVTPPADLAINCPKGVYTGYETCLNNCEPMPPNTCWQVPEITPIGEPRIFRGHCWVCGIPAKIPPVATIAYGGESQQESQQDYSQEIQKGYQQRVIAGRAFAQPYTGNGNTSWPIITGILLILATVFFVYKYHKPKK